MTTLLPDPDTKAEDEKMKEPARAWKNEYQALCSFRSAVGHHVAGEIFHGTGSWPSLDVAFTKAYGPTTAVTYGAAVWLRAFPVKE